MKDLFEPCLAYRGVLLGNLEGVTEDRMDRIPSGFRNNVRWNLAHLVATQAILTWEFCSVPIPILPEGFLSLARKGTSPADLAKNPEWFRTEDLKSYLLSLPARLEDDLPRLASAPFKRYKTSTGLVLDNIQKSISFSNIHDGIHTGVILSILKLI